MNQSNTTLAKRIAELERQLSSTKDLLESSMLSEVTAKQYAEEVDKQNSALAAQVEALRREFQDARKTLQTIASCGADSTDAEIVDVVLDESRRWVSRYDENVLKLDPQHHLRELQAEAVLNAVNFGRNQTKYFLRSSEDILQQIEQYADSIRNAKDGE